MTLSEIPRLKMDKIQYKCLNSTNEHGRFLNQQIDTTFVSNANSYVKNQPRTQTPPPPQSRPPKITFRVPQLSHLYLL